MPEPLHLLIVESSEKEAENLVQSLRNAGFILKWKRVDTETGYLATLNEGFDLILSGLELPQFNGLRALELLNRSGLEIPFILLSSVTGEDSAVLAMQKGATDYLLRDRLARLGPAITQALQQRQLRQERKKAQEELRRSEERYHRAQRMESMAAIADGIAHDLNNILSPIMMAVEMLKGTASDPHSRKILETLEANARRGSETVRQVLSFGRGLEGERIEVQPNHLLKDVQRVIWDTFPKDIRLESSVCKDPWAIWGYPTQLHQILLNLCVNARDSMPNGGLLRIRIENRILDEQFVSMTPEAKPGPHVMISVSDSGGGIPKEDIQRIFDPLFTTKEGGGLGLPTVLALVGAHEGFIEVESEPGKGTTFELFLPAKVPNQIVSERPSHADLPLGKGETVLVIDDEASVLTITSQTLEEFGYKVLPANNGAEGVALYAQRQNEIAVVLTDLMMPVMGGGATVHALLKMNPEVKVIVVSGLDPSDRALQAADSRIAHFLPKPYTARALLEKLREVIEGQ
jgi:signal transduction histidine kinase